MRKTLLGLLLWLAAIAVAQGAGPQLQTEATEFDFGEVFQGERVEKNFRFSNRGDAVLTIDRVRTSCGCTAVLLSSTRLEPGQTGEVRAVFDSTRFSGAVAKTIYVNSNDSLQPLVQFTIKGTVRQELLVTPPLADLGLIQPAAVKEVNVVLTNQGTALLRMLGTEVLAPDLTVQLSGEQLAAGQSITLRLRAEPKEGRARLNGYVIVKTDSPRVPELRIPVYGSVAAPGVP